MARLLSNVNWVRVLLAGIATHLLNVLLGVALVIAASLLTTGTGSQVLNEAPIDQLAERVTTWGIPILTVLAAAAPFLRRSTRDWRSTKR